MTALKWNSPLLVSYSYYLISSSVSNERTVNMLQNNTIGALYHCVFWLAHEACRVVFSMSNDWWFKNQANCNSVCFFHLGFKSYIHWITFLNVLTFYLSLYEGFKEMLVAFRGNCFSHISLTLSSQTHFFLLLSCDVFTMSRHVTVYRFDWLPCASCLAL